MRFIMIGAVLLSSALFSSTSLANNFFDVPLYNDAREFARLDQKMPAVLSYFSQQTQSGLRDFYISELGEPLSEQLLYGRLSLHFNVNNQQVRVMISTQNNWQQVDIMVQR